MGNKEEAEWILERLTTTLNRELKQMRKEELEMGGDKDDNIAKDKPRRGDGPSSENSQPVNDSIEKRN